MQFTTQQSSLLKPHIVSRLEKISEADNDVLADYVLELLKSDTAHPAELVANAKEQLSEFLTGQENGFVDELLGFIRSEAWDPQAVMRQKAAKAQQRADHTGARGRKRGIEDADTPMTSNAQAVSGRGRPTKAARRGARFQNATGGFDPQLAMQQLAGFTVDHNNPLAALLAMQQALAQQMGLHSLTGPAHSHRRKRAGQRCRDYNSMGFCRRGQDCPYEHELDYEDLDQSQDNEDDDEDNAMLIDAADGAPMIEERKSKPRGARKHNHRPANTTIDVRNIPPEHRNHETVENFFSQFGEIKSLDLHQDEALAIVTFESKGSAEAAYNSPKAVFDNRFVKVFRHRSSNAGISQHEELDMKEFAKRQAAAQERYEQSRAFKSKYDELQRLINDHEVEAAKLTSELARRTGQTNGHSNGNSTEHSDTEALKAKLAALESEARSMGIDPEASFDPTSTHNSRPSGLGYSYVQGVGRGGFVPRGRGRGRGRGPHFPSHGFALGGPGGSSGAVRRLDNRPRALAVTFADGLHFDGAKDEALKQFLLFNDQIQAARISALPGRDDAALVAFSERYRAESFVAALQGAAMELPHAGRVQLAWAANVDVPDGAAAEESMTGGSKGANVNGAWSQAASVSGADNGANTAGDMVVGDDIEKGQVEVDYDVADDDARWTVD